MKQAMVMIGLLFIMGTAIAQKQPATSKSANSDAAAETAAERIYTQKDHGIKPPKATYLRGPDYPDKARGSGKEGTVLLALIVGSDGVPRDAKIARSVSPDLDEAAIDAVKKWKFAPATKDGKPVPCQIMVQMRFGLH